MDIKSLEFFQKISEIKSISKVAKRSHISQSALSQQMQKMEDTLGHQLFIRSNRGVELTNSGELVLKYINNIIKTYDKMVEKLEQQQDKEIKIEADFAIATYCLPCVLVKMRKLYPKHDYNLISNSSDQIEKDVMNDICEVGFINREPDEELMFNRVIEEKVVLISLPGYDIPEKFNLAEILNQPLVILKDKCIIKDKLNQALQKAGHSMEDLNIITKLESTEALKTVVQKGYGVAFVPYNAVKKEIETKELKIARVKDYNLDYNIYMISKNKEELNSKAREFINGFVKLGNNICC
ncbi:MAG: LysR family transcriptional regulator [Halanaerobiales bacterium]|nr:LysR family transcriptional regulator [Halanaerobiales bacterium]